MDRPKFQFEVHHGRVVKSFAGRPQDVFAMFRRTVARAPQATAVVDGALRWTYADLADRVERCASRLAGLGLGAGDRLAILVDNRADYPTLLLAAARLGVIAVPLNIRQRAPETAFALADSGAVAVIFERAVEPFLPSREAAPVVRHWLALEDEVGLWRGYAGRFEAVPERGPVGEDDPFCLLYTSGTTGRPKGAVLTHFGIVTTCLGSRDHLGLGDDEAMILSVPASHVTGICLVLLLAVCIGAKVVMQRGFKARDFLVLAEAERATYAIMVPAMYALCLLDPAFAGFDLSHWRVGSYGGAPMAAATVEALGRQLPQLSLINIYGATETTSPAVMMPPGEGMRRGSQVGRPLPYAEILIMDDAGCECPRGEQGEIWIAGPMTVPGYWNNPAATAAAFTHGFWRSGDIGVMDADGYLQVLDRMKDMINRGGFKIYSVEVENVLMAHDDVVEAVVVGRPCPVLGERVEAFVVARGAVCDADLRAFCAARLSDYKVPERITAVPGPLPRNPNGKLLKSVVRGWLAD